MSLQFIKGQEWAATTKKRQKAKINNMTAFKYGVINGSNQLNETIFYFCISPLFSV